MAETLVSSLSAVAVCASTTPSWGVEGVGGGGWWWAESILLGPEGTDMLWCVCCFGLPGMACCHKPDPWVVDVVGLRGWVEVWWCGVVGWSLVENYTVDASIFVVKLSRANGGCL